MTNELRQPLIKDYTDTIHHWEKMALTGDINAIIEIISLGRVLRECLVILEQRRHGDQTIEADAANYAFYEIHEYMKIRFTEEIPE